MIRPISIFLLVLVFGAPVTDAGLQSSRATGAESWIRWPWHFPCLRIFGCYSPELPPLTPPGGPNVPGPHCQNQTPC